MLLSSMQAASLQSALAESEAVAMSLRNAAAEQANTIEQLEQGLRSKNLQLDDLQRHANGLATGAPLVAPALLLTRSCRNNPHVYAQMQNACVPGVKSFGPMIRCRLAKKRGPQATVTLIHGNGT